MNDDQQRRQQPNAPPPAAFSMPPPPPMRSSASGGQSYASQYAQPQRQPQQQQQQGFNTYQQQRSGGGTAASAPMQQPPPPLATEGSKHSTGAPAVRQFAPPPAVQNVARSASGMSNLPAPTSGGIAPQRQVQGQATIGNTSGQPTPSLYPTARYPAAASSSGYTASQFQSPYLATPASGDTLKARNVGGNVSQGGDPSQSYLLSGSNSGAQVISGSRKTESNSLSANAPTNNANNNKSIALLLLPPLSLLFLNEMSSSLPLLVLLCLGLIVYSFDLANVGDDKGQSRGYYTLIGIWFGWIFLCMIVGYDAIFLGERSDPTFVPHVENELSEEGGVASGSASIPINFFGLGLLLAKLAMSILLLFNVATWTTLQFDWLPVQMPMVAIFLERILHSTLPPVSAAMVAYGLITASAGSYGMSWGVDGVAISVSHLFAFHLALGIALVGTAPSMISGSSSGDEAAKDKKGKDESAANSHTCAIHPREGRRLSYLLVFLPAIVHMITFRQRIANYNASWDDLFDLVLIATVPYTLHYLLASNGAFDERWRRSLPWVLQVGTSPAEGGERTIRGASVPMVVSFLACMAFQHRYLVPLCARASYIINGHEGIISSALATTYLTIGTLLAYTTVWFFGRKNSNGDAFLMGDYHEDVFQVLLASSSVFYGMSCGPNWSTLPVPMLLAESLALWVISKQLRYAVLTAFVFFTVGTILVAYRLTFLSESVELLPGRMVELKKFADVSLYATMWLILLVGLVIRAQGGYGFEIMRKYDVTGVCLAIYGLMLVVLEFALLREPMPLYSRDNFEVGRVAVYSPSVAYFTGFLIILITWHLKAQMLIKQGSVLVSMSFVISKMLAVIIETSQVDVSYNPLVMLYLRWAVSSLLLITIFAPYLLKPVHVKMSVHAKRRDASAKPGTQGLPNNASSIVFIYCAVLLPLVIGSSVGFVLEPLIGLLTGQSGAKLSEIIGYSASLWGVSVLSMISHFLPGGGAEKWRRFSALTFVMGLFISFSAPAFPGASSSWDASSAFQSVSSLDTENDVASGGWGLVSAFLAILLAMSGPLELREMKDSSGRRDTRQLLRLMIFGMMFGCGLSWFITMQSMSKDIFIPIFVTTFSCMAMSTLGTVAAVMGYFLEAKEFVEAEQLANVWALVGFPVFFVISSMSLSAHAHPFGIGGWASTYLSVCGLLAGAFCLMVRLRKDKTSATRGYGNMSCIISWLCAIIVVYGRYGVAGVGVVGTTSVAGIPASILGTALCAPILILLEGEGGSGSSSRKNYQVSSTKSKKKGLVLSTLKRSNWFAPLLAGTIGVFLLSSFYAIFLRGCGVSKFGVLLFGSGDVIKNQEDVFSHVYGSTKRTTGAGAMDDVATLARKSVVHTRTMVAAAKLSGSGIWTSKNILGPLMHIFGLVSVLPSLHCLVTHSWYGSAPSPVKVRLALPLNLLSMFIGRGIPTLVAAATIGLVGGLMQASMIN